MTFPENLNDRGRYILDRVKAGEFEASWTKIDYNSGNHHLQLNVFTDALKIDGVRINVSATLQQVLADVFGASLPTPQVVDLIYNKATRRGDPQPIPITSSVKGMIEHSKKVDSALSGEGLAATVGKHWVLDQSIHGSVTKACNYGWHFTGTVYKGIKGYSCSSTMRQLNGKPVSVIQPAATAHDRQHTDYSQICQLVSQVCWVDGVEFKFSDLLLNPQLSYLVSHQGPLKIIRQPGVDVFTDFNVSI